MTHSVLFLLAGMILGAVIVYVVLKSRIALIEKSAMEKAEADGRGVQLVLEEKIDRCKQENEKILNDIQVANDKIEEKERAMERLREENKQESAARVKAEERNSHLVKLEKTVTEKEERIRELTDRLGDGKAALSKLKTQLEEQSKNNEERLQEFNETKKRMKAEFENLANAILEEKTKRFSDQNISSLNDLLKPMREQLGDFRKRVDQIHHEDSKDRTTLQEQINQLNSLNQQMNKEAKNLTRALKGDRKAQGNWGELILEKVLEQSGLRKGIEYETQGGFRDADNKLLKPDVIVHLPEGKDIIIDSKFPLSITMTM